MRILIDMDGVIYDMNTIWYDMHNKDYGHIHELTFENVTQFHVPDICAANNCPCNPHDYFMRSEMWTRGTVLDENAIAVTKQWIIDYCEVSVCTTTPNQIASNRKLSWLKHNFPHLWNVFITTTGSMKSWIQADILIDDRVDNHDGFTGISILYNQPWNQHDKILPRARDWNHVKDIVAEAERLLQNNTFLYMKTNEHKIIQDLLFRMIRNGEL